MADIGQAIGDMVGRLYPPSILFAQGMNGNMLALIGFILLSVIAAAAVIALIAVKYKKICTMIMAEQSKGNYKMTSLKTSSRMWALVMKEFKMYISYPTWVLNTSVGYILNIAAGVAVFFMKDIEQMLNIPMIPELVGIFIPILLSFFMALTSVTYPSISLEGKNMWLLLNLPIESKHIYKAKILMSLCLAVPSSLIASALFILRFRPSVFYTVMAVVIPLFYSLCAAVMGLAVNLKFPNFSWTNATAVVKNSLSATICIFGGMFMVIIPGVLLVIFMDYAAIIYSVLAVILLVLTIIFYRSIMKVNLVRLTEEN